MGKAPDHRTKLSFTLGGVEYYEFDEDIFFLPFQRGLMATMFYKELQCGADREYLLWHTSEYDRIFKDPKQFDIGRMAILNQQLKDRLQFIFDPDLIYKLASVVYFDKTENPYKYNYSYGLKKVALWRESEAVEDFFLRQPIKRLVPFFKQDEENILNYLQVAQKIKDLHSKNLTSTSSRKPSTTPNQPPLP